MFSKEMEALIEATLEDGVLTDQEKRVLFKRAEKEGIDIDELDVYIQSILQKRHRANAKKAEEEYRKSMVGDVRRCPACQKPVPVGDAICPHCGITFDTGDKGNDFVLQLREEIAKIEERYNSQIKDVKDSQATNTQIILKTRGLVQSKVSEKINLIKNHIPSNNRADLLQLLAFSKSQADINAPKCGYSDAGAFAYAEDLGYAYWCLFESCVNLASVSFKEDQAFVPFFDYYEKALTTKVEKTDNNKGGCCSIVAGVVLILLIFTACTIL